MSLSRRSILKLAAAAVMSPVVQLRPTVNAEQLLIPFCEPDAWRWKVIQRPFGVGSLTYATDSRAIVRCELLNRLEVGEQKIPPVLKIYEEFWQPEGGWVPLDSLDLSPCVPGLQSVCPVCGDRRIKWTGPGEFPDRMNESELFRAKVLSYDVDDNTIRDASCSRCHGLDDCGLSVSSVLGVAHSTFSLKRIAALPNVRVCRTAARPFALLFAADGFEGVSLGIDPQFR